MNFEQMTQVDSGHSTVLASLKEEDSIPVTNFFDFFDFFNRVSTTALSHCEFWLGVPVGRGYQRTQTSRRRGNFFQRRLHRSA